MTDIEIPKGQAVIRALRFWQEFKSVGGEIQAEDWVEYCSPGQASFTTVSDAVKRVMRDKSGKWESIAKAYEAWQRGTELPVEGTPLGAWPGCTQAQAEVLRQNGIRTIEEVACLTDTLLTRIKLPNPRALKEQAERYLEARSGVAVEEAIRKRDDEIAALKSQMEDLMALVAAPSDDGEPVKNKGGRPRKVSEEA